MSYLIVSSIQMGANIDYAIVISSRYTELRQTMDSKHAIIEALNQSFPTIITSGTILAAAGILISMLSSVGIVASIGECLGRGTIISIILVLFVLPQILVLGDIIIEKTSFVLKKAGVINHTATSGNLAVKGHVRGYVNGIVDADIRGVIQGMFEQIGMEPRIVYETEEDEVVAGLVAKGFGIAVVPYMDLLLKLDVEILQIDSPTYERSLFMVHDEKVFLPPVVGRFRQFVRNSDTLHSGMEI